MAVQIGELLVSLRASTAAFAKDLDKASQLSFNTSREIERSFKRIGTVIAAELSAATTAITASVAKSIESADQMGKLAQKTGLTVEQFSGLAYAAKIADVPVDTLAKSFVLLSKNLEKSNEKTLEGKAAHSALATLFKGNIPAFKDTNDAFEQITARLAVLPDGYTKTALAAQIFGKSGAQLIPLINQNVDGIHRLQAEAKELGIVITEKTAHAAEKFNDTIKTLQTAVQGMSLQLAEKLLPNLQALADKFLDGAKAGKKFNDNVEGVANFLKVMASAATIAWGALSALGATLAEAITILNTLSVLNLEPLAERWAEVAQGGKNIKDALKSMADTLENIWSPAVRHASDEFQIFGGVTTDIDRKLDEISKALHKRWAQEALQAAEVARVHREELAKAYGEVTKKLSEEITTLTLGSAALETFKLKALGASDAQLKFVSTLESMVKNLKAGNDAFTGMPPLLATQAKIVDKLDESYQKLLDKGFRAWEAARTPLEKYSHEVADLKVLLDAHIIDQETFNRLTREWADHLHLVATHVDDVEKLSKSFQRSIGQAFESAIMGARGFGDIMKSLIASIELAILKTLVFQQIANALKGSGGFLGFVGGIFGSIAGGGKAGGGPVSPGHHYTVGENGPETFYPAVAGNIVPNGGGGGRVANYYIDARGSSITEEQFRRSLEEFEKRAVARSIHTQRELALRSA